MAVKAFNEFSTNKSVLLGDFEMSSNAEIADLLKTFYASLRNKKGGFYSKKSMLSIRYGIQRHLQKVRQFDIVSDADFKSATLTFNSMVVKLKKPGYGATARHTVLSDEDLGILYNAFDVNSSAGLQIKVFIDLMFYFCNRDRENV